MKKEEIQGVEFELDIFDKVLNFDTIASIEAAGLVSKLSRKFKNCDGTQELTGILYKFRGHSENGYNCVLVDERENINLCVWDVMTGLNENKY